MRKRKNIDEFWAELPNQSVQTDFRPLLILCFFHIWWNHSLQSQFILGAQAADFVVSAPSEAWRILRGASPRRVRPSQSPVSSVACMAEALPGNLVGITQILKGHWESARSTIHHERHRLSEQDTRSVHRETCRP